MNKQTPKTSEESSSVAARDSASSALLESLVGDIERAMEELHQKISEVEDRTTIERWKMKDLITRCFDDSANRRNRLTAIIRLGLIKKSALEKLTLEERDAFGFGDSNDPVELPPNG